MKTAISIDRSLLEKVDALAAEWQLPRSRVFALAAQDLVRRQEDRKILEALNRVYGSAEEAGPEDDAEVVSARRRAHRRLVDGTW